MLDVPHSKPVPLKLGIEPASSAKWCPSKWNVASTLGGPGFQTLRCEFPVPSTPAYMGQSIFLWCGVQQASGVNEKKDFGVLQPVLMFGRDCVQSLREGARIGPGNDFSYEKKPYWYYSAQYVFPIDTERPHLCTTGKIFKASPGEILLSTITYDDGIDAMTVKISRLDGSNASSLTIERPNDDPRKSWKDFMGQHEILLEGALEIPDLNYPGPIPQEIFKGWTLKATVKPSPQFPLKADDQWKLEPIQENTLSVKCTHDSLMVSSDCTWAK